MSMLARQLLACAVALAVLARLAHAQDLCDVAQIGDVTDNAHSLEQQLVPGMHVLNINQMDACLDSTLIGMKVMACDEDVTPIIYLIDPAHGQVFREGSVETSGYVRITVYCEDYPEDIADEPLEPLPVMSRYALAKTLEELDGEELFKLYLLKKLDSHVSAQNPYNEQKVIAKQDADSVRRDLAIIHNVWPYQDSYSSIPSVPSDILPNLSLEEIGNEPFSPEVNSPLLKSIIPPSPISSLSKRQLLMPTDLLLRSRLAKRPTQMSYDSIPIGSYSQGKENQIFPYPLSRNSWQPEQNLSPSSLHHLETPTFIAKDAMKVLDTSQAPENDFFLLSPTNPKRIMIPKLLLLLQEQDLPSTNCPPSHTALEPKNGGLNSQHEYPQVQSYNIQNWPLVYGPKMHIGRELSSPDTSLISEPDKRNSIPTLEKFDPLLMSSILPPKCLQCLQQEKIVEGRTLPHNNSPHDYNAGLLQESNGNYVTENPLLSSTVRNSITSQNINQAGYGEQLMSSKTQPQTESEHVASTEAWKFLSQLLMSHPSFRDSTRIVMI